MEPIPETVRAIVELGPFASGGDLLEKLGEMARRVATLVPDCVGLSLVIGVGCAWAICPSSELQLAPLNGFWPVRSSRASQESFFRSRCSRQ